MITSIKTKRDKLQVYYQDKEFKIYFVPKEYKSIIKDLNRRGMITEKDLVELEKKYYPMLNKI